MNIAFDSTAIEGAKDRGIGKYTINQINALVASYPEHDFYYFNYYKTKHVGKYLEPKRNLYEVFIFCGDNAELLKNEYRNLFGGILRAFLGKYQIDVFYLTSVFFAKSPYYTKECFANTVTAATIWDLIPLLFAEQYLSNRSACEEYHLRLKTFEWVDIIFAISESAKSDLITHSSVDNNKISVIYGAPDERFKKEDYSEQAIKTLKKKYNLGDSFILSVAGNDYRKNIDGLIRGYSMLPPNLISKYKLVVACKLSETAIKKNKELAVNCGVSSSVILTGFVTDEELLQLTNTATINAFVSKYEGFGLPVVESFACEVPVVTSNNSSLLEVAGDAAIMVNPYDDISIMEGLRKALTLSTTERQEMIAKQLQQLTKFDWNKSAKIVIDQAAISLGNRKNRKIKKLAYFSPLPPIKSGISDFSVDIVTELSKKIDEITVIIDSGYSHECQFPSNVQVLSHNEFKYNEYNLVVYQVGNSVYHEYMFDYISKYQGIVELHDADLHGVLKATTVYKNGNYEKYRKAILHDLDDNKVESNCSAIMQGRATPYNLINGFVTNYAEKIITHSEWAKCELLKKDIGRDVSYIPHYSIIPSFNDEVQLRTKYGYQENEFLVAAFGFIQETKQIPSLLRVSVRLWDEGYTFKLVLVGSEEFAGEKLTDFIHSITDSEKYGDNLRITGYVGLDEFDDYCEIINVAFNLRWPYNGETSGSCSRLMARGKCVVVNNIGAFSEIEDEACVMVPSFEVLSETEKEKILYECLIKLMNDRERTASIGQKAMEYVRNKQAIEVVAEQYWKVFTSAKRTEITEKELSAFARNEAKHMDEKSLMKLCDEIAFAK